MMRIPDLRKLSIICVLAFLPFAVLWKGGKSLESTWVLLFVAWFAALSLWNIRKKNEEDIQGGIWWTGMLLLFWTVISYVRSQTQNYGLDEVFRMAAFVILLFWSARMHAHSPHFANTVIRVLAWTTLVAVAIGIAVYVMQPVSRFVGTFFDARFHTDYWPNAWAEYALLTWPIILLQARNTQKAFWLLALGTLIGCLFLSFSRGAYIAFGGQVVLWGIAIALQGKPAVKRIVPVLVLVPLFAVLTFFGVNAVRSQFHDIQSLEEKITLTSAEGTSSVDERFAFMKQAWKLTTEQPLFGYGPYSFRFAQTALQEGVFATSDHPHNLLLKTAVEEGLPAAGLLLMLLLFILVPTGIAIIRRQSTPERTLAFIAVTGVLAHVMIDYNLQFVGNALPFTLLLGLLIPVSAPVIRPALPLRRLWETAALSLLIVIAVWEGRYLIISSYGRHAEAKEQYALAAAYYDAARNENYSRDLYLSSAFVLEALGKDKEAELTLARYIRGNALDARAWLRLGKLLEKRKAYPSALGAYEKAYEYGKWNHPDALRGIISMKVYLQPTVELEVTSEEYDTVQKKYSMKTYIHTVTELDADRPEYDALLTAFHEAILRNDHFIALGTVPEEFAALTTAFADLYPADAARYSAMSKEAGAHATTERQQFTARPAGRLW